MYCGGKARVRFGERCLCHCYLLKLSGGVVTSLAVSNTQTSERLLKQRRDVGEVAR